VNSLSAGGPLTQLSEDEKMFRDSGAAVCTIEQIAPLVRRMDEEQHMDAELCESCLRWG
jgi:hypothetical protein